MLIQQLNIRGINKLNISNKKKITNTTVGELLDPVNFNMRSLVA